MRRGARGPNPSGPRRHRARGWGRLQFRLLAWFLGAIVLALGASALTTILTSSDAESPSRLVSRHVVHQVAKVWDDPAATEAYLARLREDSGLDIRARRDLPPSSRRARLRPGAVVFEDGVAYVPVVRSGAVVGALELRTGLGAPPAWRIAAALAAALVALGLVARRVSKRLARPLEHLAQMATRFGGGDLAARTGIEALPRRWVAEEVRDLGRAFDDMASRIERVVVDQRELLAAISHELRSPLGRARIALEIARDRAAPEDAAAQRPLDDVERQLVEVDAILGDLLASARAGLADAHLTDARFADWLRDRLARLSQDEAVTTLEIEGAAADLEVAFDAALLGRAVHNVLANALAHGHPAGVPIRVAVRTSSDRVVAVFTDAGPGFPADLLPRVFEPFVTGKGTARTPGAAGLGLGLALVRRIVEAHGGAVSARNAPPLGAEVTVELPVRPEARAARLAGRPQGA